MGRVKMSLAWVWIALLDLFAFVWAWGWDALRAANHQPSLSGIHTVYFVTAFIGLLVAIYAFTVLIRGGNRQLTRSTVCILLSLIPGCSALIMLLSQLGTHPV